MMVFTLTTFEACNKQYAERDFPEPTPTEQVQTVNQSFGVTIGTGTSQMTAKSWNVTTWVYKFSPNPAILTLTGTGASVGQNYTASCTVAELKAGTVTVNMLPGTYTVKYTTPHIRTTDSYVYNSVETNSLNQAVQVGDVLDIKIDNSFMITGTPLNLTATLDDALIIIDIPVNVVQVNKTNSFVVGDYLAKLLNTYNDTDKFFYAYVSQGVWLKLNGVNKIVTVDKIVDGTGYLKGNSYHLISSFNTSSSLIIPEMINQTVIVP